MLRKNIDFFVTSQRNTIIIFMIDLHDLKIIGINRYQVIYSKM